MRTTGLLLIVALIALPCSPALGQEPGGRPSPTRASRTEDGPGWKGILGWTAVGLGGAAMLTGVVFAALAAQKDSEYEEGVELLRTFEDLNEIHRKGRDYNTVMAAGLVSGLVVAVIGGHLLLWDGAERSQQRAALAPLVTAGGGGLTAKVRF
jgi:hypothetical protein